MLVFILTLSLSAVHCVFFLPPSVSFLRCWRAISFIWPFSPGARIFSFYLHFGLLCRSFLFMCIHFSYIFIYLPEIMTWGNKQDYPFCHFHWNIRKLNYSWIYARLGRKKTIIIIIMIISRENNNDHQHVPTWDWFSDARVGSGKTRGLYVTLH